nr:reverse transcriptase domain-containing protein [Tanacetum cinerariifolium]
MTAHHNHWDTSATRDKTSRNISSTTTTESQEVIRQLEMINKNFIDMMRQIQSVKSMNTKYKACGGPHSLTEFLAIGGYTKEAAYATTVDYDVDPRVPLILARPFLRTTRALIDVHGEELTLRVNDEAITFKVGAHFEILTSTSGNPTPSDPIVASSSPSFTPFEESDFILEEIETFLRTPDELSNLDDDYYDTEGDILYLENLLNEDPSSNLPPMKNEDLKQADVIMMKPSIEEPPKLELKDLPSHL